MDETPTRRFLPASLRPIGLWVVLMIGLMALGYYASPPGMPGGARALPRVPPPAPNLSVLLYQLGVGTVTWYAVVLALPLMAWGARQLAAERYGKLRVAAISCVVVMTLATTTAIVEYAILYRSAGMRPRIGSYVFLVLRQGLLPWIALAGVVVAIEGRRRANLSAIERERLRAQVAEQRFIALTGQLHPHFLFNTLQGVSTLIHRDPEAADDMLSKLAFLLRDLLRQRERVLIPLAEELRYVRAYLEIAQIRFADRLTVEIRVPEELLGLSVPLFILQPLVENALSHGIGARMRGGRITIEARRQRDRLDLVVVDDGAGIARGGVVREGIGLTNTRERLRATFGANQQLSVEPGADGGVVARIEIPCRPYSADGASV